MAATDKDLADHLRTVQREIASLTGTIAQLATETGAIRASFAQRFTNAAKSAVGAGEQFLSETEEFGAEAMHTAARRATAAVAGVQEEIEHNPLAAVLIAVGFGFVCGFLSRAASRPTPARAAPSRRTRRA